MSRVIKIGAVARLPKQDAVPKARRVVAYVRVSTDFEEQLDSLATQEDYYEKKIGEYADWSRAGIYADTLNRILIQSNLTKYAGNGLNKGFREI